MKTLLTTIGGKNEELRVQISGFVSFENQLQEDYQKLEELLQHDLTPENLEAYQVALKQANQCVKQYEAKRKEVTAHLDKLKKGVIDSENETKHPLLTLILEVKERLLLFNQEIERKAAEEAARREAEEEARKEEERKRIEFREKQDDKINYILNSISSLYLTTDNEVIEIAITTTEEEISEHTKHGALFYADDAQQKRFLQACENFIKTAKQRLGILEEQRKKQQALAETQKEAEALRIQQELEHARQMELLRKEKENAERLLREAIEAKEREEEEERRKQEEAERKAKEEENRTTAPKVKGVSRKLGEIVILDSTKVPQGIIKMSINKRALSAWIKENGEQVPGLKIEFEDIIRA